MQWPQRVQEIVNELARRNIDLVRGDDEARRALTRKIAEQCRFELGENWGTKRADDGRPLSADVVCTAFPFVGWDTQIGGIDPVASDEEVLRRHIAQMPDSIDLVGQRFVPVEPVNHLAVAEPAPTPGEPPPTEPCDDVAAFLAELVEPLDLTARGVIDLAAGISTLNAHLADIRQNGVRVRLR